MKHVTRMDQTWVANTFFRNKPKCARKLGRPILGWLEDAKHDL
jgi:hypothetical protein